jgi:hypothetical protein
MIRGTAGSVRGEQMKHFVILTATLALLLFGSSSHARGPAPSSFAPRGPEPHVTLSDMHHHSSKGHGQGASHKPGIKAMKAPHHAVHKAAGAR